VRSPDGLCAAREVPLAPTLDRIAAHAAMALTRKVFVTAQCPQFGGCCACRGTTRVTVPTLRALRGGRKAQRE
jgi:hypothetical protein